MHDITKIRSSHSSLVPMFRGLIYFLLFCTSAFYYIHKIFIYNHSIVCGKRHKYDYNASSKQWNHAYFKWYISSHNEVLGFWWRHQLSILKQIYALVREEAILHDERALKIGLWESQKHRWKMITKMEKGNTITSKIYLRHNNSWMNHAYEWIL